MRYAFIEQHQARFRTATLCRVLNVSRSGFYDWQTRVPSVRAQADVRLLAEIQRVHREHRETCGALKTWRVLNREGIAGGKHRIARLRRLHGLEVGLLLLLAELLSVDEGDLEQALGVGVVVQSAQHGLDLARHDHRQLARALIHTHTHHTHTHTQARERH